MKPQPLRSNERDWSPVIGYYVRHLPQTREQKKIERQLWREDAFRRARCR